MRDEADRRNGGVGGRRRDRRRDVPVIVNGGVRQPEAPKFGGEIPQEHELGLRARVRRRCLERLSVVADVAQEAFEDVRHGHSTYGSELLVSP